MTVQILLLLAAVYAVMSLTTFAAMAWDKAAARAGRRRIRERTLHAMCACGGWPGALVAMRAVRHKTRDPTFLPTFRVIVAAHIVLLLAAGWFLVRAG